MTEANQPSKIRGLTTFGYVSFLAMFAIALVIELLYFFFSHNLSLSLQGTNCGFTDFVHFYLAGKITLSPDRAMFYSWETQKHFLETLTQCQITGEDFYTQYVPIVFLLMAPYALLPMDCAHLLFDFVNVIFGLLGCWWLMKHFRWTNNRMAQFVILGALASMPSWNTWYLGQISWFYLGLICFYIACLLDKKDVPAGLALALTIIKPQYALFLGIPALALKRWRLILMAFLWELALFSACTMTFGIKAMLAYPSALNQCESSFKSIHTNTMFGLSSFLSFFLPHTATYKYGVILLLISLLIITASVAYALKKKSGVTINWLFANIVLAFILFSPHTHSHDCLLVAIPALLTLPFYATHTEKKPLNLVIWQWIMYLMPIISWISHLLMAANLPGNVLLTFCIVILFVCGIMQFSLENSSATVQT